MKRNARAIAAIILSGGMIGVTASPVLSTELFESQNDDGQGNTFTSTSALSTGLKAPTIDVGSSTVFKGTVQYSNQTGTQDAFNVGTLSTISASVSASSTPDYNVASKAEFGIDSSTIKQVIGTAGQTSSNNSSVSTDTSSVANTVASTQADSDFQQTTQNGGGYWWWNRRKNKRTFVSESEYTATKTAYQSELSEDITKAISASEGTSGTISGVFKKTDSTAGSGSSSNEVTVQGIGADNNIVAATGAAFDTTINKVGVALSDPSGTPTIENSGAGTAAGSASGSVNTTASANANSSQFVSSFAQAY
jgi:hypothetical protein